jgi:serine/threonine-protein kinase
MMNLDLTHLGRYRVLEELGRGAMGVVYRAEDPSLGRVVAIKAVQLSVEAADSAEYQARFYQEAKAAGGLNHPGIITIFDTGREGNWAYIAMELLEGVELRELMAQGRMPLARVLDLVAQVANALDFAHERGVVHRDIKPGNIMVLRGDLAKIMDFGIARTRVSAVQTQVGMVLGSPKYMSPEQVAGRRVDHRSDIFSLGVVLFEMVAGMAPFSGKDVGSLMYAVVNTPQPRPSQLNPAAPEMLDLIVARALQKDAAARYQSASQFAADLIACREGLSTAPVDPAARGETTVPLNVESTLSRNAPGAATTRTPVRGTAPASPAALATDAAATDDEEVTTMPLAAESTFSATAAPLLFSRRFNSSRALARLRTPSESDRAKLALVPRTPGALPNIPLLITSPRRLVLIVMIGLALIVAVSIALS